MSRKNGNILEQHVDKIILGVVGLISLGVLYAFVLTSPSSVEYDNETYGPGSIDTAIRENAKRIDARLAAPAEEVGKYKSQSDKFTTLLASAIRDINNKLWFEQPFRSVDQPLVTYELPKICDVCDIKIRKIATVAYIPTEAVDFKNPYSNAQTELADLEFITVEAKIDTVELSKRFNDCFNGDNVELEFRRPDYAKPVFAAVDLQRRELLENGNWSEWTSVERIKADNYAQFFQVPQTTDKLTRGIEVYRLMFDKVEVKSALLQPGVYDFAWPNESWLPPSLDEKRAVKPKKVLQPATDTTSRRTAQTRTSAATRNPAPAGGIGGPMGGGMPGMGGAMPGMGGATPARTATRATQPRTAATRTARADAVEKPVATARSSSKVTNPVGVDQAFVNLKITDKTDFAKIKDQLTIWAHDDSAMPGKTYQYRMRVGVLNPVAGTNKVVKENIALKNNVVLWSDYTQAGTVSVGNNWYFFPVESRDADKMVTTKIARLFLGKWYVKDFRVKPGEVMGGIVENAKGDDSEESEPNQIDYRNGVVLVDMIPAGEKDYADAICTSDAKLLKHMPVKQQFWTADMKAKYSEIETAQRDPRKDLLPRGATPGQSPMRQNGPGVMPDGMMGLPGGPMGMPGGPMMGPAGF